MVLRGHQVAVVMEEHGFTEGCFAPSSHTLVSPLRVPWVGIPHGLSSWHWPPTAPQTANAKISRHL